MKIDAVGDMVPRLVAILVTAAMIAFGGASALAQAGGNEQRLALVIGNSAYGAQPLKNPANDARAVAQSLRRLGFTVIEKIDLAKKPLEDAIIDFGEKLKSGGVGLFYYAGHAMQLRGENYLMPVDAQPGSEAAARVQSVELSLLLDLMGDARNRANVVILDSCRNNPFAGQVRGGGPGLAAVDAARGTLIAYSTAPGKVAVDGDGANSPYTAGLVRALDTPGLKAEDVFKRVRGHVIDVTKGEQTPWESSSLTGDLVLNASLAAAPPPGRRGPIIDPIDREFVTTEVARVRAQPDVAAVQVGTIPAGQSVLVLGKVRNENWYQVERDGKPYGFVALSVLRDPRLAKADEERKRQYETYVVPADRRVGSMAELRERTYREIVDYILPRFRYSSGPRQGEEFDYRGLKAAKAMVACIDWRTHVGIAYGDPPRNFSSSLRSWGARTEAPSVELARQRARDTCTESGAGKNCECVAVDENDRNVLQLPAAFAERTLAPNAPRRDPAQAAAPKPASAPPQPKVAAAPPAKEPPPVVKEDERAWNAVAKSNDTEKLAAFLQKYPDSSYAPQAKTRLVSLGWSQAQVQAFSGGRTPAQATPGGQRPQAAPSPTPSAPQAQPARPPQAAAPPPAIKNAAELRQKAYERLVKVLHGKSDYASRRDGKVMAICIDWSGNSVDAIQSKGGFYVYEGSGSPRMSEWRRQAMEGCAKYIARGCTCQIVDESEKNVLQVPEDFARRVLPRPAS